MNKIHRYVIITSIPTTHRLVLTDCNLREFRQKFQLSIEKLSVSRIPRVTLTITTILPITRKQTAS